MSWSYLNWVAILAYFLVLLWIGYHFSKKNKTNADYFIGGRKIPAWAAAISLYATGLSSISFVAITSRVYDSGWVFATAPIGIAFLIIFIAWIFVPFIRRLNVVTTYEYLEARFHHSLRLVASGVFIIFHIMRIAIVIYLPTLPLMEVMPSVNPLYLVAAVCLVCVIYTTLGGFEAVIWSDVLQTIVLVGGALVVMAIGFSSLPEGQSAWNVLANDNKLLPPEVWKWSSRDTTVWGLIVSGFFASIYQYVGSQDMVQRYSSTKNLREARKTVLLNIPLSFMSVLMYLGMASAMYIFYKFSVNGFPKLNSVNAILPYFVVNEIPMGVSGLVIAGIFAAAQSTVSSSLNSSATCIINDFVLWVKPNMAEDKLLTIAKLSSLIIGIFGGVMAMYFVIAGTGDMYELFNAVIGAFGGPIAGLFMLGIFFRKVDSAAAWVGLVCSFFASLYFANPLKLLNSFSWYQDVQLSPFLIGPVVIFICIFTALLASYFFKSACEVKTSGLTFSSLKDTSDIE